ncbi:MAG: hypothetical protein QM628_11010 [Propionicimonas sp.]
MNANRPDLVYFEFPSLNATLRARLLWDENPELCSLLVAELPFQTVYSHAFASGQCIYAPHRIVGAVKAKNQVLTELPKGTIDLATDNYKTLGIFYGKMTEPLPNRAVLRVIDEDLDEMDRVGREIFIANYVTHEVHPTEIHL